MRKKKRKTLQGRTKIAALLAVIGVSILLYQPLMNYVIGPYMLERASANYLTAEQLKANQKELFGNDQLFDYDSVQTITTLKPNPVIQSEHVVGAIYAPTVEMIMPIMYGVSHDVLLVAAGMMKPDQKMGEGNYALIGHNSKNPAALFAPIRHIEHGEKVYITDKDMIYVYRIIDKKVVQPNDIHVIDDVEGKTVLTLLSCTEDGTERVLIQGELKEKISYESASDDLLEVFNKI